MNVGARVYTAAYAAERATGCDHEKAHERATSASTQALLHLAKLETYQLTLPMQSHFRERDEAIAAAQDLSWQCVTQRPVIVEGIVVQGDLDMWALRAVLLGTELLVDGGNTTRLSSAAPLVQGRRLIAMPPRAVGQGWLVQLQVRNVGRQSARGDWQTAMLSAAVAARMPKLGGFPFAVPFLGERAGNEEQD
jgi:hypothetical protein